MSNVKLENCEKDPECKSIVKRVPWLSLPTLSASDPNTIEVLKLLERLNDKYSDVIDQRTLSLVKLYIKTLRKKLDIKPVIPVKQVISDPVGKAEPVISGHVSKVKPVTSGHVSKVKPVIPVKPDTQCPSEDKSCSLPKCGINLYSTSCELDQPFGDDGCIFKDGKCVVKSDIRMKEYKDSIISSIVSDIDKISNKDLLALLQIPVNMDEYYFLIYNDDRLEQGLNYSLISELIIRIEQNKIPDKDIKFTLIYLKFLENQLHLKLDNSKKFRFKPIDESTIFKENPGTTKPIVLSSKQSSLTSTQTVSSSTPIVLSSKHSSLTSTPRVSSSSKPLVSSSSSRSSSSSSRATVSSSARPTVSSLSSRQEAVSSQPSLASNLRHARWSSNSCYSNSMLFALLNQKNNPLITEIRESPVKKNIVMELGGKGECSNERLKELIIEYYNMIHGESSRVDFPIREIRNFLQNCTYETIIRGKGDHYGNKFWTQDQLDTNEFLRILLNHFDLKSHHKPFKLVELNIYSNPVNPVDEQQFVRRRINPDVEIPMYDWNIMSSNRLNIENNGNNFTIIGPNEDLDQANWARIENSVGKESYYQSIRSDRLFENPNMLIITLNRTFFISLEESVKLDRRVYIDFQINRFLLTSIVVHQGPTLKSGHYICYFRIGNNWFENNDMATILKPVDIMSPKIRNEIETNCTTLIYYPA
jgi:ubiquitin C-terminal hydrolase